MKKNEIYKEVVCDHFDEYEKCWCVDAWTDPDKEDNGCVVARIDGTSGNVYYMDDAAKDSPLAQEVIKLKQVEVRAEKKKVWVVTLTEYEAKTNYLNCYTEVYETEKKARLRVDEYSTKAIDLAPEHDGLDDGGELSGEYGYVTYYINGDIAKVKCAEIEIL